ncbi:MAG: PHP domain-containing protein [bacterium]|nr:PHP domain-containing protein [bacterium]
MSGSINFKGNRWFKCDLHLHTTASKCFKDKSITAEQWVQRAIEQGLDCVSVTDHNTGDMIDNIKAAARGTGLVVFPGVEITCDTSRVHLLILFDISKTTSDVNDFLIKCGITREMFADQAASSIKNIFEIADIANESCGIVIPAHVDEFNSLHTISHSNLEKFFKLPYINAVQVVHKEFTDPLLQTNKNEVLRNYLNEYYGNPPTAIDYTKMAEWQRPIKIALAKKVAITTFSDNPHEAKNTTHGLNGMGNRYTWIKMDENPTLEGLRQAFLLSDFRVKNDFGSPTILYKPPDLWIKSISITNTTITETATNLQIDFSPQLTTIIGGRGSGKSSILRFARGLFNRTADISELNEILSDQNEFYKLYESRSENGVINENTIIEIEFVRNNILHKIIASNITNSNNQTIKIQKFDSVSETWLKEEADGYIDFFQFEQYSQKQIYEIAQEPNSMRERIDKSIPEMDVLQKERQLIKKTFLEKSASIRTIQQQIAGKGKLQTEITDLDISIKLFQQSGIASLLISKEKFTTQQSIISDFIGKAKNREDEIGTLINSIPLSEIEYESFDENYSHELKRLSKVVSDGYNTINQEFVKLKEQAESLRTLFEASLTSTIWQKEFIENQIDFDTKKTELETQGVDDISNFEKLTLAKSVKEKELEKIITIEASHNAELTERQRLQNEFLEKTKAITIKRKAFVASLLHDDKVKISINPFRNKTDFLNKLRTVIQRPTSFEDDIEKLAELCFNGNVELKIKDVRELFSKIRSNQNVSEVSGFFINLVLGMTDAQIDEIQLLLPEDEIEIQYKPSGSTEFKPLSTASAGQKTTAILTFILSQGNIPLLLDQPEDDLDNRLVYELIVDRLRKAKENRQIIVVTHNANIPVNGDAEYIVSMNSQSKNLSVYCSGTIEEPKIKREICDVMEGSEKAFDMRSKRYKQI